MKDNFLDVQIAKTFKRDIVQGHFLVDEDAQIVPAKLKT